MPDKETRPADFASRLIVLLSLPALLFGCAPGRVGSRPANAPVASRPAPAASPSPIPSPSPAAETATAPAASPSPVAPPEQIDFEKQVRPLLQEKCSPCHFPGGRMYDRLPFDREETIRTLGTAMFTRLRDPVDQEFLRSFLEQPKDGPGAVPAH